MDVLTVCMSAFVSTLSTFALMLGFYKLWILPYLTKLTESVPTQCRQLLEPYVKEQIDNVFDEIDSRIDDLTKTVRTSSARFQRTVNTAARALDLEDYDLTTEDGQTAARDKLAASYGVDVAVQAISQIVQSIQASKMEAQKPKDGKSTW